MLYIVDGAAPAASLEVSQFSKPSFGREEVRRHPRGPMQIPIIDLRAALGAATVQAATVIIFHAFDVANSDAHSATDVETCVSDRGICASALT